MSLGAPPVLVKKYGNRRLYDTSLSRYVTLEELADRIRGGVDVRVVDASSGEDLTQPTLAQIILESRGGARLLPVPLLVQLIRMDDASLAEFLQGYVALALDAYGQLRRGLRAAAQYSAPALGPFAGLPFAATDAFARLMLAGLSPAVGMGAMGAPPPVAGGPVGGAGSAAPPPWESAATPRAPADPSEELSAMRRELEELKGAIRRKRGRRR
jgi:polyhydroxyalkanoate synthesis repressor PhaR